MEIEEPGPKRKWSYRYSAGFQVAEFYDVQRARIEGLFSIERTSVPFGSSRRHVATPHRKEGHSRDGANKTDRVARR